MADKPTAAKSKFPKKVRALGKPGATVGFFNGARVRAGSVFVVQTEQEFSEKWMQEVPWETPASLVRQNSTPTLRNPNVPAAAANSDVVI